jgi:branched-chain amino acid transport system substrate-binding protein
MDLGRLRYLSVGSVLAVSMMLAATVACAAGRYDEGASDTEIRIGNTNPYSGPASAYGAIGKTLDAYFRKVNDEGGINGRRLAFISYDDGYAPPKTRELVRKLVEHDKVLLIFQTLGTPSNAAIQGYLNRLGVPQLFVSTGASRWGDPKRYPWTMGYHPDYRTEAIVYARHILATVKDARIAVLMQNDDYGRDYLDGLKAGLGKDAGRIVAVATYEVADPTVDSQIIQLKAAGANVLLNVSTPKFAAQAIRKVADLEWKPAHYLNTISSWVATLRQAGVANAQGILTAQYGKDPTDPQWATAPDVVEWQAFMHKYLPNGDPADFGHAYGYAVAALMTVVLRNAGDDLTRANVMKQAASLKDVELPMLLPGIKANTSATDFYPLQSLRMARFEGETWRLFGDLISADPADR